MSWKKVKLGSILTESRIESDKPDADKRITVKLNVKGVEKRPFEAGVEGGTKYYVRKAGQFIYGKQNLFKGAFGIVPKELDGFESSQDIPAFDVSNDCLPEWIFYYFKQDDFYKTLETLATGTGSRRIQPSRLFEMEISLPDVQEQKSIIANLIKQEGKFDNLFKEIDQQQSYLQLLRKTILQEAVQGKLTESDFKNWESVTLSDVITANPKNGFSPKPVDYKTNTRCLTLTATTSGTFDATKYKYIEDLPASSQFWIEPGDILIQRGNSIEYVGMAAIYTGGSKEFIYPDLMIKVRANEKISTEFLHLVLTSSPTRSYFRKHASGTSGSMPKINQKVLNNTPISLPPLSEQQRIIEKVQALQKQLNALETQVQQSRLYASQLLQSMLKEAFDNNRTLSQVINIYSHT